jgi:hypothetical protein
MYTTESINQLVAQLEQKMRVMMQSGDYKNAVVCGTALDKVMEWQEQGQTDDLPQELESIPDVDWQGILQRNRPRLSQQVDKAIAKIERLIQEGNLPEARAQLELVAQKNASADDHLAIDATWTLLRAYDEAVRQANALRQSQPNNYDARKEAWRAVLRIAPDHQGATRELSRLDNLKVQQVAYQELMEIRRRLPEIRQRLSEVVKAHRRVGELRYDSAIQDPEIHAQVNQLYEELDDIRNAILRAGRGGRRLELEQEYDAAIEIYRAALRAGYTEIANEDSGDNSLYIEPSILLRRAIQKRNKDLLQRSSLRYADAEQSLADGLLEAAVERLEEALSLLEDVETGGDEWRAKVQKKLEEARINLRSKQRAEEFVRQSDNAADAQQGRTLLLQARDIYPGYPRLAERIRAKEEQILDQIHIDMRADLSRVEALLNERRFDEARRRVEEMFRRGRDLDFISKAAKFQEARRKAEALWDRINVAQRDDQRFQERIRSIEAALAIPDERLARSLLEAIPPEQIDREEVYFLRLRISQMNSDKETWQNAEHAFEQGQYKQVLERIASLADISQYQEQISVLQSRAQIRLWAQEAREHEEEARRRYQRILDLGAHSEEDQAILAQAQAALAQLASRLDPSPGHPASSDQQGG